MKPEVWSRLRGRRIAVPSHVAYRVFARETVLLSLKTGRYHAINAVGARFYETSRDAPSLAAAAEALAAEFEQPVERIQADLVAFLVSLSERGLVELHRSSATGELGSSAS